MDDERHPWWTVTAVFDPDGAGSDFGYTEGLATAGVPELHVWARPSLGADPGLDWKFSSRDTCTLLNRLAWRLLDGKLAVSDSWEETYDEGLVQVRFSVHEPVPASDLDAYGAGDALVLPIRWELRRPVIGRPRPMAAAALADAEATYDLLSRRRPTTSLPPGWELPPAPSWEPGARFGPRTPLVLARGAQVWDATTDDWIAIAEHVLAAHDTVPMGYAQSVSASAAREPGRVEAVVRVRSSVEEVMSRFGRTWGGPECAAVRAWFGEGLDPGPEVERGWRRMREELTLAVTSFLVVESVADLLPARVVRGGQGVVLGALSPPGVAPDERWLCSPTVDRAIADLVARTPVPDLVEAAAAWDRMFWGPVGEPVLLATLTSAASCRPVVQMLDVAACSAAAGLLAARGFGSGTLQVWLTSLATVLTDRTALAPAAVDAFLEASRSVATLERLVNTPLTTEVA